MVWVRKFFLLTTGKQIAICVCAAHLIILLSLVIHHSVTKQFKPFKAIIVKTVIPQTPIVSEKRLPPISPTPAKKTAASKPKGKAKPVPVAKSTGETIFKEIAKSLETLTTEANRSRPTPLSIPTNIKSKPEKPATVENLNSAELLVSFLQEALDLPEYGEVKAKIEIDRFGSLIDCKVLETKSAKNAEFLKNRLPELVFPCFNESQSFTITFRNVENH